MGLFWHASNAGSTESASRRNVRALDFVGMGRRRLYRLGRQAPRFFPRRTHRRKVERLEGFSKGIAVAVGFWLIALVVLGAASLALQATKASQNIRVLLPQSQLEVFLWILTSITAGVCEEIIFRGYFQRQFSAWTGNVAAGVLLSAAAFGAGHIYQGWRSAIVVLVYGSLFGILAEARESLRPGMMTHAWHDGFVGLVGRLVVK